MLYSSPVPAHSQSMLYSSPVPAHSYCNGTANCTVGHDWEALLLVGKIHLIFRENYFFRFTCHMEYSLNTVFVQLQSHQSNT
jgi:hypothetical protein